MKNGKGPAKAAGAMMRKADLMDKRSALDILNADDKSTQGDIQKVGLFFELPFLGVGGWVVSVYTGGVRCILCFGGKHLKTKMCYVKTKLAELRQVLCIQLPEKWRLFLFTVENIPSQGVLRCRPRRTEKRAGVVYKKE